MTGRDFAEQVCKLLRVGAIVVCHTLRQVVETHAPDSLLLATACALGLGERGEARQILRTIGREEAQSLLQVQCVVHAFVRPTLAIEVGQQWMIFGEQAPDAFRKSVLLEVREMPHVLVKRESAGHGSKLGLVRRHCVHHLAHEVGHDGEQIFHG